LGLKNKGRKIVFCGLAGAFPLVAGGKGIGNGVQTLSDFTTGGAKSSDCYDSDETKDECVFYEALTFFFTNKTSDEFHWNPPDKFLATATMYYRKSNAKLQIFRKSPENSLLEQMLPVYHQKEPFLWEKLQVIITAAGVKLPHVNFRTVSTRV